jgi:hypothetical protein
MPFLDKSLTCLSCLACLAFASGIAEPRDSLNDCEDDGLDSAAFLLQTHQKLLKQAIESVKPWDSHLYLVGVRHKAGSQLLRNTMRKVFDTLGASDSCRVCEGGVSIITTNGSTHMEGGKSVADVCSQKPDCTIRWHNCNLDGTALTEHRQLASKKGIPLRAVHIIRDPLQMVASAYCYHHAGNEMPGSPSAPPNIMELNATEGVPLVAVRMLPVCQAMASAHAVHNISDDYVVRYENMTRSSADFDYGVASMFDFLFENMITANERERIEAVARTEDLNSQLYNGFSDAGHVSDADCKERAQKALRLIPEPLNSTYRELQAVLGYT